MIVRFSCTAPKTCSKFSQMQKSLFRVTVPHGKIKWTHHDRKHWYHHMKIWNAYLKRQIYDRSDAAVSARNWSGRRGIRNSYSSPNVPCQRFWLVYYGNNFVLCLSDSWREKETPGIGFITWRMNLSLHSHRATHTTAICRFRDQYKIRRSEDFARLGLVFQTEPTDYSELCKKSV